MRFGGVAAAVLMMTGALQAQVALQSPVCRAEQSGEELITRITYSDGYTVEGPWRITGMVRNSAGSSLTAVLDQIVETRALQAGRQATALPGAIEMTFHGKTLDEALDEAARVWCSTVLRARPGSPSSVNDGPLQNRIM
ncbi:MAG: hypothetical protein ACT4O1_14415 [Gemmatimonadota bacterium]